MRANIDTSPRRLSNLSGVEFVVKSADETVNNSDVFQNDDELLFPVGISENWWFTMVLRTNSSAVADIKIAFDVPAGGVLNIFSTIGYGTAVNGLFDGTGTQALNGEAAARYIQFVGTYFGAAAAGNVQLKWAQNTAEATDTKVLERSTLMAIRLG